MLNKKLVLAVNEAYLVRNNKKQLNGQHYYCPHCKKRMILIVSQQKSAFFKHLNHYGNFMGEKEEHHSSKMALKAALTAAGFNAQVEVPLAAGQIRADILASPNLAFEIQCAPLSKAEYNHRHALYKKENVKDIWIVGKRHFLRQKKKKTQLIFFRRNQLWREYYLEIDPIKQILRLKYNILLEPLTNKVHYQQINFSLDEVGIQNFWKFKPILHHYHINPVKQKQYLQLQIRQKSIKGIRIAKLLYEQKMTIDDLSSSVFKHFREIGSLDTATDYLLKLSANDS